MQVVAHNMISQFTDRQLNITEKGKGKSAEKLSSGYRINRSADDAAGLQISEKMRWQIRGLDKTVDNCEAGVSFCQVADGAMNEIEDIVHRMRELSVQAANDTNTQEDRQAIQDEIDELVLEIGRITSDTEFNTKDVFGWERTVTTYAPDATTPTGWIETGTGTKVVEGNNYGLGEILGAGKIYTGQKLDDPLKFDSTGWTSTGTNVYSWSYEADDIVKQLNRYTSTTATVNDLISNAANDIVYHDYANGYRTTVKFDTSTKMLDGRFPAQSVVLEKGTYTNINDPTSFVANRKVVDHKLTQSIGSTGYDNGKNYGTAWLDFSGLDTADFQLSDLYGQGFNTTCATCSRYYSISFTGDACAQTNADGVNYNYIGGGSNSPRLEINISGCATGKDIVDHIMSAVKSCPGFNEHYTQYAVNQANGAKLYIYDARNDEADGGRSTFEPAMRNESGEMIIDGEVVVTQGNPPQSKTVYSNKNLWIQSGTTNLSGFFIERPMVNPTILGIRGIGVLDFDSASAGIATCDSALEKLNKERSKVGAQQNRLEAAVLVNDNTQENTQAAESRLRDTDMAEEMMNYSRHSILEQAGQSMLAQANQSQQGILSLFS